MSETVVTESSRLEMRELARLDLRKQFESDVRAGLTAEPKWLLPKYLYDDLGSQLFEAICLLPEYYLTRSEHEILERYAEEIADSLAGPLNLLELGSGSASKTRNLIEALLARQGELHYISIDISTGALEDSSQMLLGTYPGLRVTALAGDYFTGLQALADDPMTDRTLALFLGSNIGNFDPPEAMRFLHAVRGALRPGDGLLLGADLRKEARLLELAYDDPLGVTSAFNLNLLNRLNREFGGDFDVSAYRHLAHYNPEAGRVEIHVESLQDQTVHLRELGITVQFSAGERIHTENSHKYDLAGIETMASAAGFCLRRTWYDQARLFSSNLLVAE